MKLKFLIEYKACFKQDLYIKLLKPKAQFIPLTCHGDRYWQGTIDLNDDAFSLVEYLYVVKAKNRIIRSEALRFSHKLALNIEDNEAVVTDCWRDKLNEFAGNVAFQELIDFADNEGVIGSELSKKLYDDFQKFLSLS